MQDLKEVTHEGLYEQYRASRLRSGDSSNLSYQRRYTSSKRLLNYIAAILSTIRENNCVPVFVVN